MRNHFNNIQYKSNSIMLSDAWSDREVILGRDENGLFVFCNLTGEILSFENNEIYSRSLEILNNRLNEINKDNKFFIQRDKDMARPIKNYPFSDQCGGY